tara:strand:- start:148 stop:342 length:195 start_codon:yes stop_codon:yes gene_type:complete
MRLLAVAYEEWLDDLNECLLAEYCYVDCRSFVDLPYSLADRWRDGQDAGDAAEEILDAIEEWIS